MIEEVLWDRYWQGYAFAGEKLMNGYLLLAAAVVAVFAVLFFWLRRRDRKRLEDAYQQLLQRLDRALGGQIQHTDYDESQDAAVTERLNRLVLASGMNQERAERERDIVKSFISDISHQVRTPLTNIMLYAGLLQERKLDGESAALAGKIRTQSDKLGFFMKELMRAAYAEQEIISIHPELVRVDALIDSACQLVEMEALKKKIHIERGEMDLSCHADPKQAAALSRYANPKQAAALSCDTETKQAADLFCYADPKWTAEAIGNVLDNAVKYSPEHSRVTISVISYEAFVCIAVQDQGIGIREEEQGQVFERFYRSDAVSGAPGIGIGLYLVREVLAKQGGYARIDSSLGEGTSVCLYLSRYAKG